MIKTEKYHRMLRQKQMDLLYQGVIHTMLTVHTAQPVQIQERVKLLC